MIATMLFEFCTITIFTYCCLHSYAARIGSRQMLALSPEQRANAVHHLADLLVRREEFILQANVKDLAEAKRQGLSKPLLSRLSLNSAKLKNLSVGLKQIAESSLKVSP